MDLAALLDWSEFECPANPPNFPDLGGGRCWILNLVLVSKEISIGKGGAMKIYGTTTVRMEG